MKPSSMSMYPPRLAPCGVCFISLGLCHEVLRLNLLSSIHSQRSWLHRFRVTSRMTDDIGPFMPKYFDTTAGDRDRIALQTFPMHDHDASMQRHV